MLTFYANFLCYIILYIHVCHILNLDLFYIYKEPFNEQDHSTVGIWQIHLHMKVLLESG